MHGWTHGFQLIASGSFGRSVSDTHTSPRKNGSTSGPRSPDPSPVHSPGASQVTGAPVVAVGSQPVVSVVVLVVVPPVGSVPVDPVPLESVPPEWLSLPPPPLVVGPEVGSFDVVPPVSLVEPELPIVDDSDTVSSAAVTIM